MKWQEQGPCNYYDHNDDGQRDKKTTRRQGDKETTMTGVVSAMVRPRMCDYDYYSLEEEERQTMITRVMTAQGEGSHYDTTTRMTAMTTIMQDRLQERSIDKRDTTTSLDYDVTTSSD